MAELILGPLLRYADATSATIWVETDAPTTVEVLGTTTRTFTVYGRHYALVIVEGLQSEQVYDYDVRLDDRVVWPEADSEFPRSVIRTSVSESVCIVLGSCRAAAPHEPPYTLEKAFDDDGRGIDALWAHVSRMKERPPTEWPDLAVFIGDQVYADDSSPGARERIERLRPDDSDLPPEIVANFEEYCWLYHEAWSLASERWFLSTVPSAMMFDDHDMMDDWNISAEWVAEYRQCAWWFEHAVGGLMSYWIYQHLGNLSPEAIREDGMLDRLVEAGDGTDLLRSWAERVDFHDGEGEESYRFSHSRQVGDVCVVSIDSRHSRSFRDGKRLMVARDEWAWVREEAEQCRGHLVLATSMPVFVPDGLHDFQVWSERVCNGVWGKRIGRFGERLRRSLDLEDWSAFHESYKAFVGLLEDLREREDGPASVIIASGDIHFSYAATIGTLRGSDRGRRTPVWQVVSSPIRNALIPYERGVMRLTLTRTGTMIGATLRRLVRAPDTRPRLQLATGPLFANNLCILEYGQDGINLAIEHNVPDGDGRPELADAPSIQLT